MQCMRCKQDFDPDKTRFVAKIHEFDWGLGIEVTRPIGLGEGCCAVHLIGDRECGKPISGYRSEIVQKLGITDISDIQGYQKL